jgi:hypothetical protein
MAKKRSEHSDDMPDDFIERFTNYMAAITPRTKLNTNDVEEMRNRFANYINCTRAYKMDFGNLNCYFALGLSKDQIRNYTGAKYSENPERGEFLKGMLAYMGAFREQAISKGYIAPIPGIFAQKNYDGMKDVQEVQVTSTLEDVRDIKSIASRYQDVVDVEFEHHRQIEAPKASGSAPNPSDLKRKTEG